MTVRTEIVRSEKLPEKIMTVGTVLPNEEGEIRTETSGKIEKILFDEGSRVRKGDMLLEINDDELQAQLLRATARRTLAEQQESRARDMFNQSLLSQEEFDRAASELVVELAELASERINGRNRGPIEVLAIDDLAAFVQNNDYEVNCYLKWLIAHGPRGSVWPIAAIKTSQLWRIRDGIYEAFGTFFIGRTSSYQFPSEVDMPTARLDIPGVFTAQIGDEWMRFWIPEVT